MIIGKNPVRSPSSILSLIETHPNTLPTVPNTRPPPTEDNPDSEETAMHAAMQRELDEDEKQLVSGKSIEIKISDSTPAGA